MLRRLLLSWRGFLPRLARAVPARACRWGRL